MGVSLTGGLACHRELLGRGDLLLLLVLLLKVLLQLRTVAHHLRISRSKGSHVSSRHTARYAASIHAVWHHPGTYLWSAVILTLENHRIARPHELLLLTLAH